MITPQESVPSDAITRATLWRAIAASVVGNVLEWFDFAVYGYMVPFIGPHFFPSHDPVATNLATFTVFAIGYFARPVGAVVLGRFGDRVGRRALLVLSVAILGLSSCAIGLLPTYASIGIGAPILLVLLRLAQGFSLGGEYTGSMTYATEVAPAGRRGFFSSFATLGTMIGILLSSGAVWLTRQVLGDAALADWGWRLPFLMGFGVTLFGMWLRRHIPETMEASDVATTHDALLVVVKRHWRDLGSIIGVVTGANVALYLVFVFAVDVTAQAHRAVPVEALNTVALVVMLPFIVLGGWWSDRSGRRIVSLWSNGIILILTVPVMSLCLAARLWPGGPVLEPATAFLSAQLFMAVPIGLVYGVQGAMVAELLPKPVRCLVFSIAYGLAMALFAGSSPMLAEWMLRRRGWPDGPALYMAAWVVIAMVCVFRSRETHRDPTI